MRKVLAFSLPIISVVILIWIEQGLEVTYLWKTAAKAILFLGVPFFLFRPTRLPFLRLRKTDRKSMNIAIGSGVAIMSTILLAFTLLMPYIDIHALLVDLQEAGVTASVFPFIALYILFGNSLMEEFFFRGILPDLFRESRLRLILPSFFFAVYHIAIFLPWFSPPLLALAVTGLWIGGFIFQLANERGGTIMPSWTIHMFADIGVLIVGIYIIYF